MANWLNIGLQIAGWLAYTLFWSFASSPEPLGLPALVTSGIFTLFNAAAVYGNLLLLVPRLLDERRYWQYGLSLALLVVLSSAFLGGALYLWFSLMEPGLLSEFFYPGNLALKASIGSTTTAVFATLGIFLIVRWIRLEKHNRELREEKLQAELSLLKNQLNPHFLFNALNSIYFLIKKDPDAAADALAGFSNLLRYQLYLADSDRIPLRQELDHMEQYIRLAQLRKPQSLELKTELPQQLNGELIPPLLLLPLIENAFKFVARKGGQILIHAAVHGRQLDFHIRNNVEPALEKKKNTEDSGIGLQNIRRRLELACPDKYGLDIRKSEGWFEVNLRLNLS